MVRMALENGVSWSFKQSLLMKWLVFRGDVSQFPFHSENRTQICWTQMWCQKNHIQHILKKQGWSILTWTRGLNHDHEGGSSRARLLHCTKEWLTPAISPNVGNSTSSFLLVGICVRANPFNSTALNTIDPWLVPHNPDRFPNESSLASYLYFCVKHGCSSPTNRGRPNSLYAIKIL